MFKILEKKGCAKFHDLIEIYKLEELGLVAVNYEGSGGMNMEAWICDEYGRALNPDEKNMIFNEVKKPISFDEGGEPEDYELIGFEKFSF